MQLLNIQKNSSILYFFKGVCRQIFTRVPRIYFAYKIFFLLFRFLFGNFLKGYVDKFLYRICREKRFEQGFVQGFVQGFMQGFSTRIYFQTLHIIYIFNFSDFYSMVFIVDF
jgi:hypothetical protein